MNDLIYIPITLIIATAGGLLGKKLKVPAGTILGAIVFVVIFNLATELAYLPADSRVIMQILSGIVLGSSVSKKDVLALRLLIIPCIILIVGMVILNFFFGFIMFRFGGLDLKTSLFATAPGGLVDMALIADELGANMLQVSGLQLFRILFIFIALPGMFYRIANGKNGKSKIKTRRRQAPLPIENEVMAVGTGTQKISRSRDVKAFLLTLLVAACGGLLFWWIGLNAGALIGSMIAAAAFNVSTGKAFCPGNMRTIVQIAAGAFVGQSMDRSGLAAMRALPVPLLIMCISVLTFTLLISLVMHRLTRLDHTTCLLASAPGGLQEMALIAEDLRGDAPKVLVLQTVRLVVVIILFPVMLSAAINLFL